jgi:GTPase SAR1 family protein
MEYKNLKYSILGLDNAGKSSLVHAFQRIYGFEDYVSSIPPTVRIKHTEYTLLDYKILFWDFGGQLLYRKDYKKNATNVFENTYILLFLIDLQDEARYQESIEYLGEILNILRENRILPSSSVNICFSKCDSEALHGTMLDYKDRIDMIKSLINQTYSDFNFSYFTTSIHNLFSIVRVFSSTLQDFFPVSQELQTLFKFYRRKFEFEDAFLLNKNGFALANYTGSSQDNLDLESESFEYMNYYLRIYRQMEESAIPVPYLINRTKLYDIVCYQFNLKSVCENKGSDSTINEWHQLLSENYYLTVFCDNKLNILTGNKELPKMVEDIKKILGSYFDSIPKN